MLAAAVGLRHAVRTGMLGLYLSVFVTSVGARTAPHMLRCCSAQGVAMMRIPAMLRARRLLPVSRGRRATQVMLGTLSGPGHEAGVT